eukprot:CAMPEP_0185325940 /NCGR_PEP_ID=MMETSP1363-20130426/67539_1 /TAXON_ID=38817 /ORGANISM="Gephyrocapsa oceanica, Strain RCC1303" /LENGTH=69 /DNA_ID=CAMNT_0027924655 /DNA_START=36 /DNA_END=242 /DNA_ORIENTATION=-
MEGSEVPLERIVRSESSHSDRQIVSVIKTCLAQGSCQQPRGSGMQLAKQRTASRSEPRSREAPPGRWEA